MLVLPATAPLRAVCHLRLLVCDRPDVPQRVLATACRRQGVVVALVFDRGGPDGTAELELAVEVAPHLRGLLVERIAALVDVLEVRPRAARGSGG
jgi:hypothetical protein